MTSVELWPTTTPGGLRGSDSAAGGNGAQAEGSLGIVLGRMYGLPAAVHLVSPAGRRQGTSVGPPATARICCCRWTAGCAVPRAISRAAPRIAKPSFHGPPRRTIERNAGKWRRCRICGLTPSLGTSRPARRRSTWFQRRLLTLGDRFWTVKQIARNSEHPAHSGAGPCPKRQAATSARLPARDFSAAASRSWAVSASP